MSDLRDHVLLKLSSGRFICLLAVLLVYVVGSVWELTSSGILPEWSKSMIGIVVGWYIRAGFEKATKP